MDILVTGFGPFPRIRVNPTSRLAEAVAQKLARSGRGCEALILETSYAGGLPALRSHLETAKPKAVLMLGLAARARFIRVELFARGHSSLLHPDATGGAPGRPSGGRRALPARSTANAQGALAILRRAGLRARLSPSAGRYLCDACYAAALGRLSAEGVPVLFVHIPRLRPAAGGAPKRRVAPFRPDAAALGVALAEIGRMMARAGR